MLLPWSHFQWPNRTHLSKCPSGISQSHPRAKPQSWAMAMGSTPFFFDWQKGGNPDLLCCCYGFPNQCWQKIRDLIFREKPEVSSLPTCFNKSSSQVLRKMGLPWFSCWFLRCFKQDWAMIPWSWAMIPWSLHFMWICIASFQFAHGSIA